MRDLITSQVGPYAQDKGENRLAVEGPRIVLGASVAHGLGLVLHELATNASKYGALSTEGGKVSIEWTRISLDDRDAIRLIWRESGGPDVKAPENTGFGTFLIQESLSHSIGGTTEVDYARDGVVARIECPIRTGDDK